MESVHIFTCAVAWLIFLVSAVGNVTLIVVLKRHFKRTARGYICLMLNLAVADLVLVASSIPFTFVERLQEPAFPFGALLCKLLWPLQTSAAMTAIFTVVMLSCQRYLMIVRPAEKYQQGNLVTILSTLFTLWLLPVLTAALPLGLTLQLGQDEKCQETWSDKHKQYFTVYLTLIQYVLPLGVIAWCNGRAVVELKKHAVYRENFAIISPSVLARHTNVVRMLMCIVAVFATFWFPGQLSWLVLTFSKGSDRWKTLLEISELFVFANSALNPLIFFAYNDEFKGPGFSALTRNARKIRCPHRKRLTARHHCRRTGSATAHMLTTV